MSEKKTAANLSADQSKFIYWFNGLLPILTNVVTTWSVYRTAQRKKMSNIARYNQHVNEVSRQFTSGTIGLVTYFGGGELTRALINSFMSLKAKLNPSSKNGTPGNVRTLKDGDKEVAMIMGAGLASFFGYGWLRPWFSTTLVSQFQKEGKTDDLALPKKGIFESLDRATKKGFSVERAKAEIEVTLKEQARKAAIDAKGKYADNTFARKAQEYVDRTFFQKGEPLLRKAALHSAGLLSLYLGTLTTAVWGLHRLVGMTETDKKASDAPHSDQSKPMPAPSLPQLMPNPHKPLTLSSHAIPMVPAPPFYQLAQPGIYAPLTGISYR